MSKHLTPEQLANLYATLHGHRTTFSVNGFTTANRPVEELDEKLGEIWKSLEQYISPPAEEENDG